METAVIGLAASGKTTIFSALTGQAVAAADMAGGRKQARLAEVAVPDGRVDTLSAMFKPKKTTFATVLFRDQPLEHTPEGGITPASLGEARRADALALVVRAFQSDAVPHPMKGGLNPLRDLRSLMDSLVFGDYEVAEKRMARIEKEGKKDTREYKELEKAAGILGEGKLLGTDFFSPEDAKLFAGFGFLTTKPMTVIINTGEASVDTAEAEKEAEARALPVFPIRGDMEMEIAQLPAEDQKGFLADIGITEPAKNRFLRHVYSTLKLQSFLTTGEDEVRAWSIKEGTPAVKAAGVIHTDLEKGFIRAEVVFWEDLVQAGGYPQAKKAGKVRLEGKEYVVKDGDVLLIRFNV
jgi:ribosome-binding ATPase